MSRSDTFWATHRRGPEGEAALSTDASMRFATLHVEWNPETIAALQYSYGVVLRAEGASSSSSSTGTPPPRAPSAEGYRGELEAPRGSHAGPDVF